MGDNEQTTGMPGISTTSEEFKMGGNAMRGKLGIRWQKIVSWLAVLGTAHVVDDGSENKDWLSNKRPSKLHLVSRNG
jgi:hypothetical protein